MPKRICLIVIVGCQFLLSLLESAVGRREEEEVRGGERRREEVRDGETEKKEKNNTTTADRVSLLHDTHPWKDARWYFECYTHKLATRIYNIYLRFPPTFFHSNEENITAQGEKLNTMI